MTLPSRLKCLTANPGASLAAIAAVESLLGVSLPSDYRDFLTESDGIEGFISEVNYIFLWPSSEIYSLNKEYSVSEFVPGVVLLGTDGGDTGYGFRVVGGSIEYIVVPLVGMGIDGVLCWGCSLGEFLDWVVGGSGVDSPVG